MSASSDVQSGSKFEDVLRHELHLVAARRAQLDVERGELAEDGAPPDRPPLETAWHARLLGVAFSGGGIRSATLNLGLLQGLARSGVLRYVDYLSTVSGGGYIGSWLTALSQRRFARNPEDARRVGVGTDSLLDFNREGFRSFEKSLAWAAGDGGRSGGPEREDRAVRFLREFSNYLTPKLGVFSGDTWALIAIYVRNALLNQLVLLLALAGLLLVPRLLSPFVASASADNATEFRVWMAVALVLLVFTCWHLGKNLAGVTAPRSRAAEPSPHVIQRIGVPLLLIGISAASWLGHLGPTLAALAAGESLTHWRTWVAAGVVGAAMNVVTWTLAWLSARKHAAGGWTDVERGFWKTMIGYSPVAGALFGVVLHAAGLMLFTNEVYSGFKLLAAPPALALAVLLAGVLHLGLAGKSVSAQYAEWISRFGGLMLIGTVGWIAFNGLVLLGPLLVAWLQGLWEAVISSGWLLTTFASVVFGRSVVESSGRLPRLFMQLAPWIFIVGLGVALAALLQAGLHAGVTGVVGPEYTEAPAAKDAFYAHFSREQPSEIFGRIEVGGSAVEVRGVADAAAEAGGSLATLMTDYGSWLASTENPSLVAFVIVLAFLLTWRVSLRVDINLFSLNGMYANRLVRCYLGASVPDRAPNPFSGLSARDDLQLLAAPRAVGALNMLVHPLADGAIAGGEPAAGGRTVYPGPYHLINTAINLVAGGNLAYQERKAGAFLLSPLYCGFQLDSSSSEGSRGKVIDAYRPTSEFSSEPRPLTLGEAIATSGAAASPNMGYHSTPAFAFLMGIFNIRLGRWVGNPYSEGQQEKTWLRSGPRVALFHLLREAFGLTDKDSGYVYLSDGGHFENLGIYELVRRRCRYIIACDAGADERYGFEDLGNAIRKCRTDLGVEIDLDVRQIGAIDEQRYNGAPCAVGSIRYSEDEVGTLLYVKASRRAGLPSDVVHYASEHPAFPHESTADQSFSESQFESYRRLGHFLAGEILGVSRAIASDGVDVDQLFRDLDERWYQPSTAIASNFGRLAEEVDQLFERLRTSKELAFLSRQFYPEWRNLLGATLLDPAVQAADIAFVPRDEDELRQGFYFCNSLIQLMESVYVGLDLEANWRHPDNRGWLNVFNHWAWSGMFRVTWAVSAATYGGRFRSFCEQRLNLDLGAVHVERVLHGKASDADLARSGLNRHEQRQAAAVIRRTDADLEVFRLELQVRHPLADAGTAPLVTFGFGYAVLQGDRLLMYRVQDHLRGMGLGRKGLVALVRDTGRTKLEFGTAEADIQLEFFAQFHEQTDRAKLADFRAMVVSVNEEIAARGEGRV